MGGSLKISPIIMMLNKNIFLLFFNFIVVFECLANDIASRVNPNFKVERPEFCAPYLTDIHLFKRLSPEEELHFINEIFGSQRNLESINFRQFYLSKGLKDHSSAFSDTERWSFAFEPSRVKAGIDLVDEKLKYLQTSLNRRLLPDKNDWSNLSILVKKYEMLKLDPVTNAADIMYIHQYLKLAFSKLVSVELLASAEMAKSYNPKSGDDLGKIIHRGRWLPIGDSGRFYFSDFLSATEAAQKKWESLVNSSNSNIDLSLGFRNGVFDFSFFARYMGGTFPRLARNNSK